MNTNTSLTILSTKIRQDAEGRYCLNDCWRAAGSDDAKRPSLWMRSGQVQELANELSTDSCFGSFPPLATQKGGNTPGIYAAKELVYAYAMWINASFHLTVIRAFDAMVTGRLPAPRKKRAKPVDVAFRQFRNIAALIPNLDENQRLLAADRGTFNLCGISPLSEMGVMALPAPANESHMTVTAIGKALGGLSGQVVNKQLCEMGYQTKNEGAGSADLKWLPTEKGKGFSRVFDEVRKGGHGAQQVLKWSPRIIEKLRTYHAKVEGEVA